MISKSFKKNFPIEEYRMKNYKDKTIEDYSFKRKINSELTLLGTIHNSNFSKEKVMDVISKDNYDCIGLEIPRFVYNYNYGSVDYLCKLEELKNDNLTFSTRYLINAIIQSNNSQSIFEDFFGLSRDKSSEFMVASNYAKKNKINVEFIDMGWCEKEKYHLEKQNSLIKLYVGYKIKKNKNLVKKKPEYSHLLKEDKAIKTILCEDEKQILRSLKPIEKSSINNIRNKKILKNIKELLNKNQKVLIVTGIHHYKYILENINHFHE